MKTKIAFDFILDHLHLLPVRIKPMFGCHAIYLNEKIFLITRKKNHHKEANGIWIATDKHHHESLRKELPSLHSVSILSDGKAETSWQMIHEGAGNFEESAVTICGMIAKGNERIGKVPKSKLKNKRPV